MSSVIPSPFSRPASASVAGLVSTAAQAFAGLKSFPDGIGNGLGAGASDVVLKVGTTLPYASVNEGARLFSVRTDIGGTESELLRVSRPTSYGAATVTIDSKNVTNTKGLLLINQGPGVSGITIWNASNFDVGALASASWAINAVNRGLLFTQNNNAYDTTKQIKFSVGTCNTVASSVPAVEIEVAANIQSGQDAFRVGIPSLPYLQVTNAGKLKTYGDLEVSGYPNSRISCDGSRVDIGNGGTIPARALYMVGSSATTAFYASANGAFSAPNTARLWSETKGGTAGDNCALSGTYISTALDDGARLHAFGKNLSNASPTLYSAIMGNGEFEHFTAGAGIVLQSPDGTRWRLTITNAGAVNVAAA